MNELFPSIHFLSVQHGQLNNIEKNNPFLIKKKIRTLNTRLVIVFELLLRNSTMSFDFLASGNERDVFFLFIFPPRITCCIWMARKIPTTKDQIHDFHLMQIICIR